MSSTTDQSAAGAAGATVAAGLALSPAVAEFAQDALEGLARPQKAISSKYFYDERGSALFDEITELDEYYPTRTERSILESSARSMAARLGPGCVLVEYGSGSSIKIRLLLDALESPAAYVPIDVSEEHLLRSAASIAADYPGLRVEPLVGDFTQPVTLPDSAPVAARRIAYFPGSTIGNFRPGDARTLLSGIASLVGEDGGALIGVDLEKPLSVLEPAYNDARGVTAAFNLNVLRRMNEELAADFDLSSFEHLAFYNGDGHRIEMHLVSSVQQDVRVAGTLFQFDAGETIHTEYSHKYTPQRFDELARRSGLKIVESWTDPRDWFGVFYLEAASA